MIRFRVWDGEKMWYPEDNDDWMHEAYMLGADGTITQYRESVGMESLECYVMTYDKDDGFFAMLSTGLKDKNGKEIWEGDVVQYKRPGEPEVTAEAGITALFRIQSVEVIVDPEMQKLWAEEKYEYETLGNKYENPELLEEVA